MSKTFQEMQKQAHQTAVKKGWWINPESFLERVARIHASASKAGEAHRDGHKLNKVWQEGLKPCGVAADLADVIIYCMDTASALQIPLAETLEKKLNYNETLPYKMGKKVA